MRNDRLNQGARCALDTATHPRQDGCRALPGTLLGQSLGQSLGQPLGLRVGTVLEQGIALAFCPPEVALGDEVAIDVRGDAVPATVVKPPFVTATPAEPIG